MESCASVCPYGSEKTFDKLQAACAIVRLRLDSSVPCADDLLRGVYTHEPIYTCGSPERPDTDQAIPSIALNTYTDFAKQSGLSFGQILELHNSGQLSPELYAD